MDSSQLDHTDKSSPETSSDSSVSPDSPDKSGISGEPLIHPRVGDEYQVEIPPILCESELLNLMINPAESGGIVESYHSFLMGLPIPVIWVSNQANRIKYERIESFNNSHAVYTNGPMKKSENKAMNQINPNKKDPTVKVDASNYLVPGLPTESWSEFEADCFLLGLYIFGKNLLQVKKFMESKEMGQILSFYYGRFYGSAGYCKWSDCRKTRTRKCVLGHRFFTGYRQQELFSRVFPRLSEESKAKLLEASRAFTEGRTSLEEYVSALKALVGLQALVEAVGIGKGKEDLTTLFLDSSKNNQMFSHRPEMPSGKACSSLTCAEIVKYLTGDFRLSKARSNDLFWEAVWPRLLARGWHSEQPRSDGYTGSKNCLVFLMPGIKKFSRRKLSRGDHYFDSVSDVLAKVASEPELLELEADETTKPSGSSKEANGWPVQVNSDDDDDDQDPLDHERHCYLKPRVSTGLSDLLKFTVVDTSLAHEDNNPSRVRELRSLPLEAKRTSAVSSQLRKTETQTEEGKTDILPNGVESSCFSSHAKGLLTDIGVSQRMQSNSLHPLKIPGDSNPLFDHKSRAIKHQFSRRLKPHSSTSLNNNAVTKRRKLASCLESDVTCVLSLPARYKNSFRIRGASKHATSSKLSKSHLKVSSADSSASGSASMNVFPLKLSHSHLKVSSADSSAPVSDSKNVVPSKMSHSHLNISSADSSVPGSASKNVFPSKLTQSHLKVSSADSSVSGSVSENFIPSKLSEPHLKVSAVDSSVSRTPSEKIRKESPKENPFSSEVFRGSEEKPEAKKKVIDLNIPQVPSDEPESDENVKVENNTNPPSDAERPKVSDNAPGFSDSKEPLVRCTPEPSNKDEGSSDQQPPRRQSTRNRPLTTKALEALEIGFLNPVRKSRKRVPPLTLDQKSKRSRQPRSKSSMFPNVMGFEDDSATVEITCNGNTDVPIPTERVAEVARGFLGLPEASFHPAAS